MQGWMHSKLLRCKISGFFSSLLGLIPSEAREKILTGPFVYVANLERQMM
jgi:hypothetical protein